jgi:hypothetical protein
MSQPTTDDRSTDTTTTETATETTTPGAIPGIDRQLDTPIILRVVGVVWLTLVGWRLAGSVGVAVGLLLAVGATIVRPVILVALAHAGLVVLVPDSTSLTALTAIGLFELGVIAILLSDPPVDRPAASLTVAFGLLLGGATIATQIWAELLAASLVLLVLVAVIGYGIHRYEQVALGLVDPEPIETDQHHE